MPPAKNALLEGPILRSLLTLAVPIVAANVLQSAYQIIDAFWVGRLGGAAVAVLFVSQLVLVIRSFTPGAKPFPEVQIANDALNIGNKLFGYYNLPFQVIGVLILVASIGVVVLSKRELK